MLDERGVRPESLAPAEDIKKLKRKLDSDDKNVLKEARKLKSKKKK
jgi:DNA-damage-inducible protein D